MANAGKLLISGLSGAGKTSLTKDLEEVLVIYHDGKSYNFPKMHATVRSFDSTNDLLDLVISKIEKYKEKKGNYPKIVVFDSVSKIFDTISNNCNEKFTNYDIHSNLNKEITAFTTFVEESLIASGINVVIISHAAYDHENARYSLVGSGAFAKRGGFFAETDHALFLEAKAKKRLIHFRSSKFPARTLRDEDPDFMDAKDFNLQDYLDILLTSHKNVSEYEID